MGDTSDSLYVPMLVPLGCLIYARTALDGRFKFYLRRHTAQFEAQLS